MHAQPHQHVLNLGLLAAAENWECWKIFKLYKISLVCYLKILYKSESEKEQSEKSEKEKSEQYWLQVKIPRKFCTSEEEVLKLRIFKLFSVALLIILLK